MGPSCLGSPASTTWPPRGLLGFRRLDMAMRASGSTAWPASSMKTWVKWSKGKSAEASLQRKRNAFFGCSYDSKILS